MVVMPTATGRVGAGFRIERCLDFLHVPAEALDHFGDHVIGANTDPVAEQLDRQMPVAEMPSDTNQFIVLMRMNFQQRFRPRSDAHYTVLHRQPIAIAQPHSLRQIEQNFGTGFGRQNDPATVATVEIDQNMIDFMGRIPAASGQDTIAAHQNRKYRCAIGNTVAGSHVRRTPSARTS